MITFLKGSWISFVCAILSFFLGITLEDFEYVFTVCLAAFSAFVGIVSGIQNIIRYDLEIKYWKHRNKKFDYPEGE